MDESMKKILKPGTLLVEGPRGALSSIRYGSDGKFIPSTWKNIRKPEKKS